MATALSSLSLTALVEHIDADLSLVGQQLVLPGSLTPGRRALAAQHLRVLRAQLSALHRVVRRDEVDQNAFDDEITAPIRRCAFSRDESVSDLDGDMRSHSHARE